MAIKINTLKSMDNGKLRLEEKIRGKALSYYGIVCSEIEKIEEVMNFYNIPHSSNKYIHAKNNVLEGIYGYYKHFDKKKPILQTNSKKTKTPEIPSVFSCMVEFNRINFHVSREISLLESLMESLNRHPLETIYRKNKNNFVKSFENYHKIVSSMLDRHEKEQK